MIKLIGIWGASGFGSEVLPLVRDKALCVIVVIAVTPLLYPTKTKSPHKFYALVR